MGPGASVPCDMAIALKGGHGVVKHMIRKGPIRRTSVLFRA
jgi:hypothetical protein